MNGYDYDKAAARADLCRFLSACYYQPGPEFGEEKVFDSMLGAAIRIDPDLAMRARRLGEEFSGDALEDLLVDYSRLFLGPTEIIAKPYGSVWLDDQKNLMGDSTIAVLDLYKEAGFEIDQTFRELPDHVAAELEFLYLLIYRENEARQTGATETLETMSGFRRRFLAEHLARWIGPFTAAVDSGARSGFYRELAQITERFVKMEAGAHSPS